MFQSSNPGTDYEPLETALPRLPSYRVYNEVRTDSVEAIRLRHDSGESLAHKKIGTNVAPGRSSWSSLMRLVKRFRGTDNRVNHWKPVTLRAPILGGFVFFSVAVIVLLEILAHISSGNGNSNGGGLAFAADVNSLSSLATFGFLYLPTVIAVAYSMLWSWVDLDTKRLEPWFQLSKPDGASAKDSLLLQYPFDFLPFVPITAGRRKHWGVFWAGTIMLLVFWIITPLQSAMFNTGTVVRTLNSTMGDSAALIPVENQTNALNANFFNTAYGISWLSQKLPAFTTSKYAVLPFHPTVEDSNMLPTETWSTETNIYFTNLTCTPATVAQHPLGYTFDNGEGCSVSGVTLPDTMGLGNYSYMINYIGYYDNPLLDWALQNPNCTDEFSNNFLALFAAASSRVSNGVYSNLTALFCQPHYHIERSYIQINASDYSIVTGTVIESSEVANIGDVFNTSNFELLLGVGTGEQKSNYPDSTVLEQYPRLQDLNITRPISNMVGFALALNPTSIEDLAPPTALQEAFERAHQLLFTVAFSTLTDTIDISSLQKLRPGIRQDTPGAVIMVRLISIVVEIAFGIIALLSFSLWYHSHYRPSNLVEDPASIADVMSVIRFDAETTTDAFKDNGSLTTVTLLQRLSARSFYLSASGNGKRDAGLVEVQCKALKPGTKSKPEKPLVLKKTKPFSPVEPMELRLSVGIPFIVILLASIGVLSFLTFWSFKHRGISLPSNNTVVLSILENYLPTTFATFIEPTWVILNRSLCVLQPFEELRKGHAKANASVGVKYTSLPPQMVIWRAMRSRHFLLAAVCVVAVSTNVLAVSLSALLSASPTTVKYPTLTSQNLLPSFNGTPINTVPAGINYADHFYVVLSNLSSGTALPSWVDQNFFYLPFSLPPPPATSNSGTPLQTLGFLGSTTGFGAEVTCVEMLPGPSENTVLFQTNEDGSSVQFSTSYNHPNGSTTTCVHPRGSSHTSNDTTNGINKFTGDLSALEVMQIMNPSSGSDDGGLCAAMVVAGWVRADVTNSSGPPNIDFTFISCSQKLLVAEFDVVVDSNGHMINSSRTSQYVEDLAPYFNGNLTEIGLFQQSSFLVAPPNVGDFVWHNDSFTSDWANSLLEIMQGDSSTLVNPNSPVPKAADMALTMEKLYRQLFTVLLGLNTHVFSEAQESTSMLVDIIAVESRLFVSSEMFTVSIVILTLHFIVAIVYYTNRPRRFLPRMPTSIASVIAYVTASRALEAARGNDDLGGKMGEHTYGYGRFIGTDGKIHIGIERQRYVVPLESRNPEVKRRRWNWKRTHEDEKVPRTWI